MLHARQIAMALLGGTAMILTSAAVRAGDAEPQQPLPLPVSVAITDLTPFAIDLGGVQFDPLLGQPDFDEGWNRVRDDVDDLHLVQFAGPTQARWLDELQARGLRVIQYVHPYTYIVWGKTAAVRDAAGRGDNGPQAGIADIRWTGDFAPACRVLPRWRNLPALPIDVHVAIYRGSDVKGVIQQITALGADNTSRRSIDSAFDIASFRMPGSLLQAAANIPGVYSIQPVPLDGGLRGEMTDMINLAAPNGLVGPGYQAWLTSAGVNGAGVLIANVDGGVQETHPDLSSRFVPCVGSTCSTTSSSHGTHTAGIMAATGESGVLSGPGGFLRGLGVAPGANLIEQVYSPWYQQAGGMLLLMTQSRANNASLSGNSWGPSGTPLGYDMNTRQCDVGVRDTDPATPGDQALSFVLSFMNGNGGTSTQGTPDEGKNIFTIGSTNGQTSATAQITTINNVSSNSAHGPALDGRKIPHMVAPGCSVDSTYPTNTHNLLCGTSMASPHVSGAVALFIQKYRMLPNYTTDPTPALIKAAFVGNCFDLAGNLDADNGVLGHPFDSKQGWGRMNLAGVITPPANSTRYFDTPQLLDNTGEEWSTTVMPLDPNQPMRIMLVWTDAPGAGLGGSTPAWVNDLDLIVDTPGGQFRGNNFNASTGWSQTGGVADNKNNTEGVFLGPTAPGSATIRVRASNIAGDGVPNAGDSTDQDFAVVVYNGAVEPGFALQATPAQQTVCAPATGDFNLQTTQILGFADPITLTAAGLPSGASVAFVPNPVAPGASSTMTITPNAAAPGSYPITVTGTAGAVVRQTPVTFNLSTSSPGTVALTSPANNATNVSLLPTLSWSAASQAASYTVEVSLSAGFGTLAYSASGVTGTSHTLTTTLASDTPYFWRVRPTNACSGGSNSATFGFRTAPVPAILLVDDDDNTPDVRPTYESALTALGLTWDLWNTNNTDNEPTAAQLAPYKLVIWFTGHEFGGACGPGAAGEAALTTWLGTGQKCLFICSQDYHYDRSLTPFMTGYLGVATVNNDVAQTSATGSNVMTGYGPYSLTYPYTNFSDRINVGNGGLVAFTGNQGTSAVSKDGGTYRTMFWGYPLEAVPSATDCQALMLKIVNWCGELVPPPPPCPADINHDSLVNIADLLAVITAWGPCPAPPAACPADINANGQVNVADLFGVISAWGSCP